MLHKAMLIPCALRSSLPLDRSPPVRCDSFLLGATPSVRRAHRCWQRTQKWVTLPTATVQILIFLRDSAHTVRRANHSDL